MRVRIQAPPPWKDCEYGEYEKEAMTLRHAFVEKGEPGVLVLQYRWDERGETGPNWDAGGWGEETHFVVHLYSGEFLEGKIGNDHIPSRRLLVSQTSRLAIWIPSSKRPQLFHERVTGFIAAKLLTRTGKPRVAVNLDDLHDAISRPMKR